MTVLVNIRRFCWFYGFVAITLLLSRATGAQSLTLGELSGVVRDAARRPVAAAGVRVEERASGAVRLVTTMRDGSFKVSALPAGRYLVRVEALGYRPVIHMDVDVSPTRAARLVTSLRQASPPVMVVDTVPRRDDASSNGDWLFERGFGELVGTRRLLSEVSSLSSTADDSAIEGLPWRFTEALVDGARVGFVGAPGGLGADGAGLALPTRAFASARAGGLGFDVEVGGSGVGINATSLRGGQRSALRGISEGGTANLGAVIALGGSVQGDTSQAYGGIDVQRGIVGPVIGAEGDERRDERVSAFGRIDWRPSESIAMSARASGSRFTSNGVAEQVGIGSAYGDGFEAVGVQGSANLFVRRSPKLLYEGRVTADFGEAIGVAAAPRALFAPTGLDVGSTIGGPFEDRRTTIRLTGLMHYAAGNHRIKAGFTTSASQHDARSVREGDGVFAFGAFDDANPLGRRGVWRQTVLPTYDGTFQTRETSLFVQDAWQVFDGLTLTLGLRTESFGLPIRRLERNADWLDATGVDLTAVSGPSLSVSPRVGLRWEIGRNGEWVVEAGGGIFRDLPDRRDLSEALVFDRGAGVLTSTGELSTWPLAPSAPAVAGRTLTMLAPKFEGPRTRRLSVAVSRRVAGWNTSLSGVYRHTDFLTRRRDLNLPTIAVGTDAFGRPLLGTLQQIGEIVAPVLGSNRRFDGFDAVYALEATGTSSFGGVTAAIERVALDGLTMGASYTYSRTLDNVIGFSGMRLNPFPDGLNGQDWSAGTSDLDVPHRLVLAADWAASRAIRFGAVYQLRSGLPFTPSVRGGVDANGDGDWLNDPASFDASLPGMDAVTNQWGCVRSTVGGMAKRNACRGALRNRLDLRATLAVGEFAAGRLALVLEALDVIPDVRGPVDNALLLVDPAGSLSVDPVSGAIRVPYVVNSKFGTILSDRSPGVLWRVGVRITP